jgi:hypothetical protein
MLWRACIVLLYLLLVGCAAPPPTDEAVAQEIVGQLAKGSFAEVTRRFDPTMTTALPAAKLGETWATLTAQMGAFQDQGATRSEEVQGYHAVYVPCRFAKGALDAKVVFDKEHRVSGLFFTPAGG